MNLENVLASGAKLGSIAWYGKLFLGIRTVLVSGGLTFLVSRSISVIEQVTGSPLGTAAIERAVADGILLPWMHLTGHHSLRD